jgi:hypothetical protein
MKSTLRPFNNILDVRAYNYSLLSTLGQSLLETAKDGEIYSVRYEAVNAMLLNEFL